LADDDIDLLLCLGHLIGRGLKQRGPSNLRELDPYQAVFVDEVQDFTEQQVFLMVEQANPKYQAVTIVGDIAQKLHHGSSIDLPACFPGRAVPHIRLTENMRQSNMPGLALFSATFRSELQNDDIVSTHLVAKARAQGASLVSPQFLLCDSEEATDEIIIDALSKITRSQTVAVLFTDAVAAANVHSRLEQRLREHLIETELSTSVNLARRHIRHFTAVANAKGLEFDVVLLVGVEGYDLDSASDVNRLYVGVTRARQSLVLLSSIPALSPKLSRVRAVYEQLTT
jgi:DNA helicase IV